MVKGKKEVIFGTRYITREYYFCHCGKKCEGKIGIGVHKSRAHGKGTVRLLGEVMLTYGEDCKSVRIVGMRRSGLAMDVLVDVPSAIYSGLRAEAVE